MWSVLCGDYFFCCCSIKQKRNSLSLCSVCVPFNLHVNRIFQWLKCVDWKFHSQNCVSKIETEETTISNQCFSFGWCHFAMERKKMINVCLKMRQRQKDKTEKLVMTVRPHPTNRIYLSLSGSGALQCDRMLQCAVCAQCAKCDLCDNISISKYHTRYAFWIEKPSQSFRWQHQQYSKYMNIWPISKINRKVSLLHKSMKHEKKNVR